MSEVSTKTRDITRGTVKEAIKVAIDRQGEGYAKCLAGCKVVGQLVELEGRRMFVLDLNHLVDLSISPAEAPHEGGDFTVEVDDATVLPLVTQRSLKERLGAYIQFGKDYDRRMGVARMLPGVLLSAEEEAFEGFSEDATMNDVVIFWVNKLDFNQEDLESMAFYQAVGVVDLPFDVRELTAVEDRDQLM